MFVGGIFRDDVSECKIHTCSFVWMTAQAPRQQLVPITGEGTLTGYTKW